MQVLIKKQLKNIQRNLEKSNQININYDGLIVFKLPQFIKEDLQTFCKQNNIKTSDFMRKVLTNAQIKQAGHDARVIDTINKASGQLAKTSRLINQALCNDELNKEQIDDIQSDIKKIKNELNKLTNGDLE